jgi:hypothetical protein
VSTSACGLSNGSQVGRRVVTFGHRGPFLEAFVDAFSEQVFALFVRARCSDHGSGTGSTRIFRPRLHTRPDQFADVLDGGVSLRARASATSASSAFAAFSRRSASRGATAAQRIAHTAERVCPMLWCLPSSRLSLCPPAASPPRRSAPSPGRRRSAFAWRPS